MFLLPLPVAKAPRISEASGAVVAQTGPVRLMNDMAAAARLLNKLWTLIPHPSGLWYCLARQPHFASLQLADFAERGWRCLCRHLLWG